MERIGYYFKNALALKSGISNIDFCEGKILHFREKDYVENLKNTIQPICAGILMTKSGKILTIQKDDNSIGQNSLEKHKTLLFVGGHLNYLDRDYNASNTFLNGARREIKEELGLDIFLNCEEVLKSFIVYIPSSQKTAKHLGVMHTLLLDDEFQPSFCEGKANFIDIDKALKLDNLEDWSKSIAQEIAI